MLVQFSIIADKQS